MSVTLVPDLEEKFGCGTPIVRGAWVRVRQPNSLLPGRTIEYRGEVRDILKEESGRVLLLVRELDVDHDRTTDALFCEPKKRPKRRR